MIDTDTDIVFFIYIYSMSTDFSDNIYIFTYELETMIQYSNDLRLENKSVHS
jgi:hypothetical protein